MQQRLEVGQVAGQVGTAGDEPHAQRGREGLGEAADVDRAFQLVQRREARRRHRLEVGQRVVLDDQQVVLLCQLQHLEGLGGRQVRAGRVVCHRLGEEQARPVHDQQLLQRLEVGPVGAARHAEHLGARHLQFAEQRVVARVVHQHLAAGRHEVADDQVHRLVGALRQHHLRRLGPDADVGQLAHDVFAQRRIAVAAAVAEEGAQAGAHDLVVELVQPHVGQPLDGRIAVAHGQRVGPRLELLAHQPHDVHRTAQAAALVLGRRGRHRALQHVVAGAAARLDQPARHQQLEGGDHRVLGVAVQFGQLAQRGQLVARPVRAVGDLPLDRVGQLDGA